MEELSLVDATLSEVPNTNIEFWEPKLGTESERLTSTKDLKEVQIGPHAHQVTNIGTLLSI